MDRREETKHEGNRYKQELEEQKKKEIDFSKQYIEEDGKKFRVPYRIVKRVVFPGIKKEELRDIPHSARLQYRLLLLDAVLKATVNFTRSTITVIYNPVTSDNLKEKISRQGIIDFLAKEGVNVDADIAREEDYDYVKSFYNYAFNPLPVREHTPYGYTKEQWKELKEAWREKTLQYAITNKESFKKWQEAYYNEYILGIKPEAPKKRSKIDEILGKKPNEEKKN